MNLDRLNIVYVSGDKPGDTNVDNWRCINPAAALIRAGHNVVVISTEEFNGHLRDEACEHADLIVVERGLWAATIQTVAYWRARGIPVIVDFDDAYDRLPFSAPSMTFWKYGLYVSEAEADKGKDIILHEHPALAQFTDALQHMVVAATMPSRLLQSDWQWANTCYYLPNYPDTEHYIHRKKVPHSGVNLFWSGTNTHLQSFTATGIIPALINVCRDRPQVKVIICGDHERILRTLSGIPAHQKELRPWVDYAHWPDPIMDGDIGFVPLSDSSNGFDFRRSPIKVYELFLLRKRLLATRCPPYQEIIDAGFAENFIENTPEAWYAGLIDRIDHPKKYEASVKAGYAYALKLDIFDNIQTYVYVYGEIINANQTQDR
jgi:hypothetical protein